MNLDPSRIARWAVGEDERMTATEALRLREEGAAQLRGYQREYSARIDAAAFSTSSYQTVSDGEGLTVEKLRRARDQLLEAQRQAEAEARAQAFEEEQRLRLLVETYELQGFSVRIYEDVERYRVVLRMGRNDHWYQELIDPSELYRLRGVSAVFEVLRYVLERGAAAIARAERAPQQPPEMRVTFSEFAQDYQRHAALRPDSWRVGRYRPDTLEEREQREIAAARGEGDADRNAPGWAPKLERGKAMPR